MESYRETERRLARLEREHPPEGVACVVLYADGALMRSSSGSTAWLSLAEAQPYMDDALVKVYPATAAFDPDAA